MDRVYPIENRQEVSLVKCNDLDQAARNRAAIRLILAWLADGSGYDEKMWPALQKSIEENRLSDRQRFRLDGSAES